MRFDVLLQSAAIKILRQKLSQVSFSAGFPFRFKMAQVFFSSAFYLALLAALALCAFLVRLIGTTSDPEPDPKSKPKPEKLIQPGDTPANNQISKDVSQDQNIREKPQPDNSEQPVNNSNSPTVHSDASFSKARSELPLVHKQSSGVIPQQNYSLVSPLTLFLLTDTGKNSEIKKGPASNKRVSARSKESPSKTRKLD